MGKPLVGATPCGCPKTRAGTGACPYKDFSIPKSEFLIEGLSLLFRPNFFFGITPWNGRNAQHGWAPTPLLAEGTAR